MRSYLFGYGGTASEAQEYVTHQRHDFRYRNSHSILVYVEFVRCSEEPFIGRISG